MYFGVFNFYFFFNRNKVFQLVRKKKKKKSTKINYLLTSRCSNPALMVKNYLYHFALLHSQSKRRVPAHRILLPPPPRPHCLASSISPLSKFLSLCISPSLQFKSDRCLSGTSELWSGSDESHKPGPTARPQLLVCQHKLPHLEAHPGTGAAF